jgi:hypothetical protein
LVPPSPLSHSSFHCTLFLSGVPSSSSSSSSNIPVSFHFCPSQRSLTSICRLLPPARSFKLEPLRPHMHTLSPLSPSPPLPLSPLSPSLPPPSSLLSSSPSRLPLTARARMAWRKIYAHSRSSTRIIPPSSELIHCPSPQPTASSSSASIPPHPPHPPPPHSCRPHHATTKLTRTILPHLSFPQVCAVSLVHGDDDVEATELLTGGGFLGDLPKGGKHGNDLVRDLKASSSGGGKGIEAALQVARYHPRHHTLNDADEHGCRSQLHIPGPEPGGNHMMQRGFRP